MLANPTQKLVRQQSAEIKLYIPQAYVRFMTRRYVRSMLLYVAAGLAIGWGVKLLVRQPISVGSLMNCLALILLNVIAFNPGMGTFSFNPRWFYAVNENGIFLRAENDVLNPNGYSVLSTKRIKVISVEAASWQEYPALRVIYQNSRGKPQSSLLVYSSEQEPLVHERVMPYLLPSVQP